MKKLISIDGVIAAFASAIGYGLGYAIPDSLGLGTLISLLICLTVGSLPGMIATKVIFSKYVQEKKSRRIISFVAVLTVFFLAYLIGLKCFNYNLFTELPADLSGEILIPIVALVASLVIRYLKTKKIKDKYGDGQEGFRLDKKDEEYVSSLNGTNKKIEGEYDSSLAVKTENGIFVCEKAKKVKAYLGIPFAQPPVGALRWKAPQPVKSSADVFEAKYMGPSPIQANNERNALKFHTQSEDCLYLNVWCPVEKTPNPKKNVVVYIPGGDFTYGGAANPLWDGTNFVEKHPDTVFVSFNYRLGLFGFIDFSGIPGGEEYPEAKNLGIFDQIEALNWVRRNIASFGGDAENITVMGDSSGAISIEMLAVCPKAKGLFRRAVILAGSPETAAAPSLTEENSLAEMLMKEFSVSAVKELLSVSEKSLAEFSQGHAYDLRNPSFDGIFFPKDPYKAYADGETGDIDFIFAVSKDEAGIYEAVVGEEFVSSLVGPYIRTVLDSLNKEQAEAVEAVISQKAQEIGREKAERWFVNSWYSTMSILRLAGSLKKAGKSVRCFSWDAQNLIEKLGSGTVEIVATLLSNHEAAETLGSLVDSNIELIMHGLIGKFVTGNTPELTNNEIKGVTAISWKQYPEMLVVSEKKIECKKDFIDDKDFMKLLDVVNK